MDKRLDMVLDKSKNDFDISLQKFNKIFGPENINQHQINEIENKKEVFLQKYDILFKKYEIISK